VFQYVFQSHYRFLKKRKLKIKKKGKKQKKRAKLVERADDRFHVGGRCDGGGTKAEAFALAGWWS